MCVCVCVCTQADGDVCTWVRLDEALYMAQNPLRGKLDVVQLLRKTLKLRVELSHRLSLTQLLSSELQ